MGPSKNCWILCKSGDCVLSYRRMLNLDTSFSVRGTLIISSVPDLLHYSGKFIKSQNYINIS